jgi:glycosyltransferase involved in cell wall biosynthesis
MRILVATEHGGPVGGIETYLRAVAPALRAAGHDLGWLIGRPEQTGVADGGPVWAAADGLDGPAAWRPDVAYLHGLEDPAREAALAERFPTVWFAHGFHGTCVSLTKTHQAPTPRPCGRAYGVGCLAHYYPHRCGGLNPLTMLTLYRREGRRRRTFPRYRAVLAASRYAAANLAANGVPAATVVPLFPTGSAADPGPPAPRPFSNRVLFAGRIIALKGWPQLAEAVPLASAKLGRPLTLAVAGDGPDRAAFEEAARGPAEFLGWVGTDRREAEMRAADVLAVPSVWPEPFGLVGIEAGGVGLPAAGFAVGGVPDWLVPGVGGESATGDPPTAAGLADALVRVLADAGHWQRLRVGAWESARRFTAEVHLAKLLPILERAAGMG